MVVLHMTKSELPFFASHLSFITVPLFLGFFVPQPYILQSAFVTCAVVTAYHLLFAVSSVWDISAYLGIEAFRISPKKE